MINDGKGKKDIDISSMRDLDEKSLFELYQKDRHNVELRNAIFQRYQYLAEILAKKYINRGVDYQDLYQIAAMGLINAIERFDVARGYRFSSFATPTIIGEIKKYFRDKEWMIRVPRRLQKLAKKVNQAKQELTHRLNRMPTVAELAQYLNTTEESILEAIEAGNVYSPQSLDEYYNNNNGKDRDVLLWDLVGSYDRNLKLIEDKDFIERCIKRLTDKELKVLKDRFFKGKTQLEIAKDLNVSQMTVSRIEKRIIEKFRKELTS